MSWLSPVRVLGICGVWLAVQTGCGGNPAVSHIDPGADGGKGGGGKASSGGSSGGIVIITGGVGDSEGGSEEKAKKVCGKGKPETGGVLEDGKTDDKDGWSGDWQTG